jgi:AbrB family looped-hinge helix DNA binding protein
MQTELLEKGEVVLPSSIRRKLGLKSGDKFETEVHNGKIILSPALPKKKYRKPRIITSAVTGLPVLEVDPAAPKITSEMVREMLNELP